MQLGVVVAAFDENPSSSSSLPEAVFDVGAHPTVPLRVTVLDSPAGTLPSAHDTLPSPFWQLFEHPVMVKPDGRASNRVTL
jgi:hypothetical protein